MPKIFSWILLMCLGQPHIVANKTEAVENSVEKTAENDIQKMANNIISRIEVLRGLKSKRQVTASSQSADDMMAKMIADFDRDVIASDLKKADLVLARMGIQPEEVDTKELTLQLLKEGVAGFYDPYEKELFVIEGQSNKEAEATMAHELVHALQDQHFYLNDLPHKGAGNSDFSTAMTCVIEGDAKYLELQYLKKFLKIDQEATWLKDMPAGGAFVDPRYPKNARMKTIIFKDLIFPYTYGTRFVRQVYLKGGWDAVNRLYNDPPTSSEQVIHPEKFLDPKTRDHPVVIEAHDFIDWLDGDYEIILSDTMGELEIDRLILNFFDRKSIDAERIGEGWEGDRIIGFVRKKDTVPSYVWLSCWETEKDAKEFVGAMKAIFQKRFPGPIPTEIPEKVVALHQDTVSWINRQGKNVLILDGESLETTQRLAKKCLDSTQMIEKKFTKFWDKDNESKPEQPTK